MVDCLVCQIQDFYLHFQHTHVSIYHLVLYAFDVKVNLLAAVTLYFSPQSLPTEQYVGIISNKTKSKVKG